MTMAIRLASCRRGAPLESGVLITIEEVKDFEVIPAWESRVRCSGSHPFNPNLDLYVPGPDEEFVIRAGDKRGAVSIVLSRTEARDLARKILEDTALLCGRCAMVDVSEGTHRGMCEECYGEVCGEEEG
jgi:hypothetical protein